MKINVISALCESLKQQFPIEWLCLNSIKLATWQQGFSGLYHQLGRIVPDITHQFSTVLLNTEYLRVNVRATHAFQMSLVNRALDPHKNPGKGTIGIVDIGDSAGTHTKYIKSLHKDRQFNCLSVNLDREAVKRIKAHGLQAAHGRAEDLEYPSSTQVFLTFALLEHLVNPCGLLHKLSKYPDCKALVVTVPYVAQSRVGLRHIRLNNKRTVCAENTHIFEISPKDWQLIFKHSGWAVVYEQVYYQYPRHVPIVSWFFKRFWARNDFEGFYGAILKPDKTWSKLYADW